MNSFDERMQQLGSRFMERSLAERGELEAALAAGDHGTAIRILHSLAGNAGMFGYPALSEAARDLEQALAGDAPERDIRRMRQCLMDEFPQRDSAASQEPERGWRG